MDLAQRPEEAKDGWPFPWKTIVIYAAVGKFAFETYVNWRQLRVLRRWNIPSENDRREWDIKRTRFRIFSSFCSVLQVVGLIGLDVVPSLWRFVVDKETKLLEGTELDHLYLSHEFDRSSIFMICCWMVYLVINLPTYFYRTLILKERVVRDFYSRKNRNWAIQDVARGRPVAAVMLFTGLFALEFKIFGLKFDGNYVLGVGALQLLFVFLYPICMQPKRKTLSVMEPGKTRDAIEELAAAAKFPLKNTYVIDDQDRQDVLVFGLPRRKYVAIPKTMVEEGNPNDVVSLAAYAMGSWKYSNGLRVFCVGQMYFNLTWTYLSLFANIRTNYKAFGFNDEYPRMAAVVIFTIALAPLMATIFSLNINYMGRKNDFIADKFAAELGHSAALIGVLEKKQAAAAEGAGDIDLLFSLYHNPFPAMSERLAALEKLAGEKAAKEEGLISLTEDEKK